MSDTFNFEIPNFFGENFRFPQFSLRTDCLNTGSFFPGVSSYAARPFIPNFTPFFNIFDFSFNNITIPPLNMGTSIFNYTPMPLFGNYTYTQPQTFVPQAAAVVQQPAAEVKPAEPQRDSYEPEDTDANRVTTTPTPPSAPVQTPRANTRRAVAGLDSNTYISEEVLPGCYVHKGKYLNTKDLKPYMKEALVKLSRKAEELGYTLVVSDGFRSHAAQVDLKRRKPRLAATPGKSAHEYGVAVDVGLYKDGKFVDIYKTVPEFGAYAESIGLEWGARWRTKYEPWHFNIRDWRELADVRPEYRQYNHLA